MRVGAMVLAVCGVGHGYQAAPAKGSIEGQVMNVKAGAPLKKANVQLVMMNPVGGGGRAGGGPAPVRKAATTEAVTGADSGCFSLHPVKTRHGSAMSSAPLATIDGDRIDMMKAPIAIRVDSGYQSTLQ